MPVGPLHSRLDLASNASGVRWGRVHAADTFRAWQVPADVTDSALLVVSELLTNAVRHARLPFEDADGGSRTLGCSLLLFLTGRGLTVAVYDQDARPPKTVDAALDSESGRGLLLVQSLSDRWGFTPNASGKLVWALLRMPAAPHSADQRKLYARPYLPVCRGEAVTA